MYYKLKRTQNTPLFPAQFQDYTEFPVRPYFKEFRLIYDLPAALKLYADNVGFTRAVNRRA